MVVLHPAYARRMVETAAAIKERTLSALDRLLYQLEEIDARGPVAAAGALDRLNMAIGTVAGMDFIGMFAREDHPQLVQLRTILQEANDLANDMILAHITQRLKALAGAGPQSCMT